MGESDVNSLMWFVIGAIVIGALIWAAVTIFT